jgi:hypothetical protein
MIQVDLRGMKAGFPWSTKLAYKSGLDIAPNPKLSPRFGESTRSRVFHLFDVLRRREKGARPAPLGRLYNSETG